MVNCFSAFTGLLHLKQTLKDLTKVRNVHKDLLLALILVGSLQMIHFPKCVQGFLDAVLMKNIKTEIKDAVVCIAVVITFTTSHPRSQAPAKDFMDPCCFRKLGLNFSVIV
jgi:hypothetical protein